MNEAKSKYPPSPATPDDLFTPGVADPVGDLVKSLPPLPPVIRYYDEFDERVRSIPEFRTSNKLQLSHNGRVVYIDLAQCSPDWSLLLKHIMAFMLNNSLAIGTIICYILPIRCLEQRDLSLLLTSGPRGIKETWSHLRSYYSNRNQAFFASLKHLLYMLCKYHLSGWAEPYADFISTKLPLPHKDKFATVRSGDAFLTVTEEAAIVRYLDEVSAFLMQNCGDISDHDLHSAGMLVCAYQLGMRPVQIASVTKRDVRVWHHSETQHPSVHIIFKMLKQKGRFNGFPLSRKIHEKWCLIFNEIVTRNQLRDGGKLFFGVRSNHEATQRILSLASAITGAETSATDLRHTAAQRLADAGASNEELAEFLGHSDSSTCLVYYRTSYNQTERVNRAFEKSVIYQNVVQIARDKYISDAELKRLKGDQQIAGVVFGAPIAGIGACLCGQPQCPSNPVTACYTCPKFIPCNDLSVHTRVLDSVRDTISMFEHFSRGENHAPAAEQLTATVIAIEEVIEDLEGAYT